MTRGDTLIAALGITDAFGTEYTPASGDGIRFAMKRRYDEPDVLIRKDLDMSEDVLTLRLDPDDTEDLEFGQYVYDMQLTYSDGAVDTIIAEGRIEILPEVE